MGGTLHGAFQEQPEEKEEIVMGSSRVKVSVVVPNYNYARFLRQRMESVLNQTFQDFELIILDDNSTDNSREIIEEYRSHPKVGAIIFNEHNSGSPCRQWKKGCDMAKGDFIWIAEADDFCEPAFLEKAVEALEENKDAGLFFSGSYQNTDGDGAFVSRWLDRRSLPKFKPEKNRDSYVFDGLFYLHNYMSFVNSIYNASGVVFRRTAADGKAWDYVSGFDSLGDWALWSYIIGRSKVVICPEPLNRFRMHRKRATERYSKEYGYYLETLRIVEANSIALSDRERMVRMMRHYRRAKRCLGDEGKWASFNKAVTDTYGSDFLKKAEFSYNINRLLLLTPWHIGFTEARRTRP